MDRISGTDKIEWKELLGIFNLYLYQVNIPEIADWIKDLNQASMFGIFRRDYMSKSEITFRDAF